MSQTIAMATTVARTNESGVRTVCVDLDGTLIATDSLCETLLLACRRQPWIVFWLPIWLYRGRAFLKEQLVQRAAPDVCTFPYDEQLLEWLRAQKAAGSTLVLATGANQVIAEAVADHLGIFSLVLSSSSTRNLVGSEKLRVLEARFGPGEFDYIANSSADLPIWRSLGRAHVAGAPARLIAQLKASGLEVIVSGRTPRLTLRLIAHQLRVHQWAKNLLVALPVFASHRITEPGLWVATLLTMVAFSLVASAFYIFNDLMDLASDRQHPRKRLRPLASGAFGIVPAIALMSVVLACGLAVAASVGLNVLLCTLLYLAGTCSYSLYGKRLLLIDTLILTGLYILRVIAGGLATEIHLSSWTLGYTSFLFLSLALMKRYSEMLLRSEGAQNGRIPGRAYELRDLPILGGIGIGAGLTAAIMMALYLCSPEVANLYSRPEVLWPVCMIHVYWITRAWILTNRSAMHDDPVVFALRDHVTRKLCLVAAALLIIASR